MILHIRGDEVTTLYSERLDLSPLGPVTIRRASHVEPDDAGRWNADIIGGPTLGPFARRSEALKAEVAWLERHAGEANGGTV